jgi:nicotinate-nucleotide adenylyltransferase
VRIGLFGGTFDPPHVGHLLAATDALDALALDRVVFVPAAQQPLKAGQPVAPAHHRLEMLRLLAGDDPRFGVDAIEIERGGLSYTIDTLRALRARWRAESAPALFLLIGADVLHTLNLWREPEQIATLAEIVVLTRAVETTAGDTRVAPPGVRVLATRRLDVSSTEVRARVREGRSIRGFVPDEVAAYIARNGLYREPAPAC